MVVNFLLLCSVHYMDITNGKYALNGKISFVQDFFTSSFGKKSTFNLDFENFSSRLLWISIYINKYTKLAVFWEKLH